MGERINNEIATFLQALDKLPRNDKRGQNCYNISMRIGIYDPYLDDLGGGEKYMMTIAQCLLPDHEVTVFWDHAHDLEMLSHRFSMDLSHIKLERNIFSPSSSTITRMLATKKFDVLFFLSDGSIPLTLSKKLFIHLQQPLDQMSKNSLKDRLKLSRITKIFCNSEYTRLVNDTRFHIPTDVIYPPVALYPKNVKKENIILHVGRFRVKNVRGVDDYKKQGIMLKTFKEMVDKGLKGWRFILAVSIREQDKELFETVKQSVRGYPVEFLVNLSNRELWDVYSQAKIYWHASGYGENLEVHPEYAEHFGISTVEAMGGGAVPVVINAGGQTEIVNHAENGFLWSTLDELQQYTLRLTKDPKLLQGLSKNATVRAQYFAGDRFCREIRKLLDSPGVTPGSLEE